MLNPFDTVSNSQTGNVKVQGTLPIKAPAFCTQPFWYVSGVEKKVKIGTKAFNYIDYLEAYQNIDCHTFRSREALYKILKEIEKAFASIEKK